MKICELFCDIQYLAINDRFFFAGGWIRSATYNFSQHHRIIVWSSVDPKGDQNNRRCRPVPRDRVDGLRGAARPRPSRSGLVRFCGSLAHLWSPVTIGQVGQLAVSLRLYQILCQNVDVSTYGHRFLTTDPYQKGADGHEADQT